MSDAIDLTTRTWHQGTYGKLSHEVVVFNMANGDANPSTHRGAKVPLGIYIIDAILYITTASNASVTANIGVKSVTGTNQDNATFFASAQSLAAVAMVRKTSTAAPFLTAQEMYIQLVIGGAAVTQTVRAELHVIYVNVGTP